LRRRWIAGSSPAMTDGAAVDRKDNAMLEPDHPMTMDQMPVQMPGAPTTPAQARARFFNSGNAFTRQLSTVPSSYFRREPALALDASTPTGLIACDLSQELGCAFPATTPLMLARYARIRAGERLETQFVASGSLWYVISGAGFTEDASERIAWQAGDIFVLPGGDIHRHQAGLDGAVLWLVSNEPQLAFEEIKTVAPGSAPTGMVHYPADEIRRQLDRIYQVAMGAAAAGLAIMFSSDAQEKNRTVLPTLSVDLSSLPPGQSQRAHRHNSVALQLLIQGEGVYSMVGGERHDWASWITAVTPPGEVHSVHNEGKKLALCLTAQDSGLHRYARTMGFSFA
jgi:gentisate 1,2-dioxygenase